MTAARNSVKRSTAREDALLSALLAGHSIDEAPSIAGISRTTAWRIRKTESFQRAYRERKNEMLEAAVGTLHNFSLDFVKALHEVATDTKQHGSARAQAARNGIEAMLKAIEVLDLSNRVLKLEQASGEITE
jgi:hypothetical protein